MSRKHVFSDRSLPSFDNHYNNGVLIDNWQEGRIYEATGRVFTIAMDTPVGRSLSTYTKDYTRPDNASIQPMMRRHGLGKELMFGSGKPTIFNYIATSTTYGESQRHLIDSKYSKSIRSKGETNKTLSESPPYTFIGPSYIEVNKSSAEDDLYGQFRTTKAAMDLSVACHHFQRQMPCKER